MGGLTAETHIGRRQTCRMHALLSSNFIIITIYIIYIYTYIYIYIYVTISHS